MPFLYYADTVYRWCHANKPSNYKYPEYKQIWLTGVGAASFKVLSSIITLLAKPVFRRIVPKNENEDEHTWLQKVNKGTNCLVSLVYFMISASWGFHILKNSEWLPSFLGG